MAKILVVDDEHMTSEMLSTFLRLLGHEAIEAYNGKQALEKLAYTEPTAILLDIMLPDVNGIDLCRQLRADPATAHLPIIIISAHAPPMIQQAEEAGANGYLAKPISLQSLKTALLKAGVTS